jgi:hypothetical protein
MPTRHRSRAVGSDRKRHGHNYKSLLIEPLEGRRLLSATLYVDASSSGPVQDGSSWADAYADLQLALAAANAGDQIDVAGGTYKPTSGNDRTATFQLKDGVALYGGYAGVGAPDPDARDVAAHPSVLSGDIGNIGDNTDNSYHVVTGSSTDATAVLDGFTITAGMADATAPAPGYSGGAGMLNISGSPTINDCIFRANAVTGQFSRGGAMLNFTLSSPMITQCTFTQNTASVSGPVTGSSSYGGAVAISNSSPTLIYCVFSDNHDDDQSGSTFSIIPGRGGAIATFGGVGTSAPVLTGCLFTGNTAGAGGGVYSYDSLCTLSGCTFTSNNATEGGGGMYVESPHGKNLILTNCTFTANATGGNGAGVYNYYNASSSAAISNCIFTANTAGGSGGGMYNLTAHPALSNCTFSGNTANSGGGLSTGGPFAVTLSNCILWGNAASDGQISVNSPTPIVSNSDVQGGFAGAGNIDADPQFVRNPSPGPDGQWGTADDDYGDLRLQADSPCIDGGDNTAVPAGVTTDLAGKPRFVDFPGVNDPGAIVDMGAYEHGPLASIAARQVFYNDSSFDGNDPAAGPADDAAIAPDKSALLPGQIATAANYTTFFHGLNGIMIDVLNLADPTALSAADFSFKSGPGPDPAFWSSAPAPASISVRSGAGADGSDRITLIWPDGVLQNTWLQVSVNATASTGLAAPDVFYFGNLIGDANGNGQVTVADVAMTKSLSGQAADITAPADFNRSGQISVADIAIVKASQGNSIAMFNAPVPLPAPAQVPLAASVQAALTTKSAIPAATVAAIPPAPPQPLFARGHEKRRPWESANGSLIFASRNLITLSR